MRRLCARFKKRAFLFLRAPNKTQDELMFSDGERALYRVVTVLTEAVWQPHLYLKLCGIG